MVPSDNLGPASDAGPFFVPAEYAIRSDYRTITIGARTQYVVKVAPEDYDFLMQWKWTYALSHGPWSGLVYARRSISSPSGNVTILMHRVILIERMGIERPSERHFTDHDNGDSLDNRRINDRRRAQLQWLTAKENMAKGRGVRQVPRLPDSAWEAGIPF